MSACWLKTCATRRQATSGLGDDLATAVRGASGARGGVVDAVEARVPLGLREALPAGTQAVVDRLRRHLKDTIGSHGLHRLRRAYRDADASGDGVLQLGEFVDALQRGVGFSCGRGDAEKVFAFFDKDRARTLDYAEFIDAVRGPLRDRRAASMNSA